MMVAGAMITSDQLERLIRETPPSERTLELAMIFTAARGRSPGPDFRLPSEDEKRATLAHCAELYDLRYGKEQS